MYTLRTLEPRPDEEPGPKDYYHNPVGAEIPVLDQAKSTSTMVNMLDPPKNSKVGFKTTFRAAEYRWVWISRWKWCCWTSSYREEGDESF